MESGVRVANIGGAVARGAGVHVGGTPLSAGSGVTRGESASMTQWGLYLACSLALAALLWAFAVWRYRQEKLAISA